MDSNNDNDNYQEEMEIEYPHQTPDSSEDYEDFLFKQLPTQTNQNSSITNNTRQNPNVHNTFQWLDMQPSVQFQLQTNKNNYTLKDFIQNKNPYSSNSLVSSNKKMISITNDKTSHSTFEYNSQYVEEFRQKVSMPTDCEWLSYRLNVDLLVKNRCAREEQLLTLLKSTLINVVIDLMIFYHTNSDFALQLLKIESLNLLLIVKHPKLESQIECLPDGFSKDLLSLVRSAQALEENGKLSDVSFPLIAETMMNNYLLIKPDNRTLKLIQNTFPKVIYFSFFMPLFMVTDGTNVFPVLSKKIVSLQRKYNCKIIFSGPFMRNLSPSSKNEFYHFEVFFDFTVNYWLLVIQEFVKYVNRFPRCTSHCHIDQICISYLSLNFFCCDEVKNLMKRYHMLREMDTEFASLIKWAKFHKFDRAFL